MGNDPDSCTCYRPLQHIQCMREPIGQPSRISGLVVQVIDPNLECAVLQASASCNLGVPNGVSIYDRYMWFLRLFTYNGFVVVADNHLNSDPTITVDANLWLQVRGVPISQALPTIYSVLRLCKEGKYLESGHGVGLEGLSAPNVLNVKLWV